jgi:Na+-translocating ferredoxin:NAD+ oxidoreductase RnfG subunit
MPEERRSSPIGEAVVLLSIILVTALLLFVIHQVTAPQIEKQEALQTESLLAELLPDGEDFSLAEDAEPMEGIVSIYRAGNDEGYVIVSAVKDLQGPVTVMTAIDREGQITAVRATEGEAGNTEKKPALPGFIDQYTASGNITGARISEDAKGLELPAGAPYSRRAVISGVNLAVMQYKELLGDAGADVDEEKGGDQQ